jgi:hypothetical protein
MAIPLLGAFPSNKAAVVVDTHANRVASAAMTAGQIWKESDTGLLYLYDGSAWVVWKGQGHVTKTADETVNNSATLQNDDHLFWPVEPNEQWFFKFWLFLNAASATSDFQFDISLPASATAMWNPLGTPNIGQSGWSNGGIASTAAAVVTTGVGQVGSRVGTSSQLLAGLVTIGATAGTARLRWAQNTAAVEDNKVLAGSWLELTRLAVRRLDG